MKYERHRYDSTDINCKYYINQYYNILDESILRNFIKNILGDIICIMQSTRIVKIRQQSQNILFGAINFNYFLNNILFNFGKRIDKKN